MSASAAIAMNSDLCLRSQRTGRHTASRVWPTAALAARPIRLPISMPSSSEPRKPSNNQRRDAESGSVQHEDLSVPGERERHDQQRHNDDRDRQPPAPHREPNHCSNEPYDPFPSVHANLLLFMASPCIRSERILCSAAVTCAQFRSTDAIEYGCVEKATTATGELPDGVRGKGRSSAWGLG